MEILMVERGLGEKKVQRGAMSLVRWSHAVLEEQ